MTDESDKTTNVKFYSLTQLALVSSVSMETWEVARGERKCSSDTADVLNPATQMGLITSSELWLSMELLSLITVILPRELTCSRYRPIASSEVCDIRHSRCSYNTHISLGNLLYLYSPFN